MTDRRKLYTSNRRSFFVLSRFESAALAADESAGSLVGLFVAVVVAAAAVVN